MNWDIKLLLARDLKLLQPDDYEQLSEQTIEIERMLITVVLVQKLTAERSTHTASESLNFGCGLGHARNFKPARSSIAPVKM